MRTEVRRRGELHRVLQLRDGRAEHVRGAWGSRARLQVGIGQLPSVIPSPLLLHTVSIVSCTLLGVTPCRCTLYSALYTRSVLF